MNKNKSSNIISIVFVSAYVVSMVGLIALYNHDNHNKDSIKTEQKKIEQKNAKVKDELDDDDDDVFSFASEYNKTLLAMNNNLKQR